MRTFKPRLSIKQNSGQTLKLIPLGGVGDVTKNMYVYEYGDDIIIIDCGVGFPDEGMPGVDLVIPDISYLQDKKSNIRGIIITHGHDDHIGGLPFIWPQLNVPIYGQRLTAGLIKAKFSEFNLPKNKIIEVGLNEQLKLGFFGVSFYQVAHSIPDSVGIVLDTPVGTIIHQADFKIDWTPPSGQVTDVGKVAQVGARGVKLLLIDCLRIEKPGFNRSEIWIENTFEEAAQKTLGKLLITMTSSNISRMQQAINVAVKLGRKIAIVGRSFEGNFQVARDLGYLNVPQGIIITSDSIASFHPSKVLILIAGSQGQKGSSLERVANDEHKQVKLSKEDAILFSADPIPSTESAQSALIDALTRFGVDVYYSAIQSDLHVSVLPNTEVLIRDSTGKVQLEEIQKIEDNIEAYSFDRKFCTGSWKKAKRIEHQYDGPIFKITTKSGRFVEVTKGHSLFALKNAQILEVRSENLKIGDYLIIPKMLPNLGNEQVIDLVEYISDKKGYYQQDNLIFYNGNCIGPTQLKVDNDLSRLLGYYLAEGSSPRHLSIVLNTRETDLADEIQLLIKDLLKCYIGGQIRGNAREICFGTPFLGRIFKSWFGDKAGSKRIPWFIFNATKEQKLNFLGAYINGDGAIDKGKKHSRIRIKTASKKLASNLLYLFSSVGITAHFDHIEHSPARLIGKYRVKPTHAYVIRIQGKDYLQKLLRYLSRKFQDYFENFYNDIKRSNHPQTYPPVALPVFEINLAQEVIPRANTTLSQIYHGIKNKRAILSQLFINPHIIKRDAKFIGNPLKFYIDGDVLFDPIKKIEVGYYKGPVYDLSVPGPENFLGGFGGIFLHNSGHAASEELKLMVSLIKPQFMLPIGGTFRHMKEFSRTFSEMGYKNERILNVEDGDIINIEKDKISLAGRVEVKNVFVDGLGVGDVGSVILRDRQVMSEDGVVIVVVPFDQQQGVLGGELDIVSRGFIFEKEFPEILEEAKRIIKENLLTDKKRVTDWRLIRTTIEDKLERFFYSVTERRPLILSIVVEV